MDITLFLVQIWGPVILAVGIGILVSRGHYTRVYRDIEKEPLAALAFGILAMVFGIFHIMAHNVWDSFLAGLISFLGWATFVKGAAFVILPSMADKWGNMAAKMKLIPIAAGLTLIVGLYLSYLGYLA